ncbi:MAG: Hsp70 family protein [bacterium]
MSEGAVVGIDLGTTYSVCAIVENGRARVISDTGGSYTIPSIVAVDDKGNRLVGQSAKRQSLTNPVNTVYGSKRLVGRDIHSSIIDKVQDYFKYKIDEGEQDEVLIQLRKDEYALEEIQAMILDHIRNTAQDMLGREITKAVVTVPAYFNDRQRQAIREAGKIAQLEVLRIINEPTAAALAYGFAKGLHQKLLIYDLGGGTFDVSILELRDNVFEVKATGGNTFLGGVDFDNRVLNHVIEDFKQKHDIDLSKDPMSHQRVKDAAEQAKIDLSSLPETRLNIPYITQGPDGPLTLDLSIRREKFEELVEPAIAETLELCEKVLKESGLKKEEIDAILLVGGSTRVPMVAKKVADFIGKPPSKNVHPDEAVALGAAILADSLINKESDIMLLDVLPINIGIGLPNGKLLPVFERNTSVPNQKMKVFTTSRDNQESLKIKLMQGDSENAEDCEPIGEFVFRGIHPAPKGKARVEALFQMNNEGILSVTARDPDTGVEQSGELKVASTLQKTYRKDLIQPKKPAAQKEAQKTVTRTVTRERTFKSTQEKKPDASQSKQQAAAQNAKTNKTAEKPADKTATPEAKAAPQKQSGGTAQQEASSKPASTTPPLPQKPPPKPGFFARLFRKDKSGKKAKKQKKKK